MKTTIQASADVALIKYWGRKNEQLRLPENDSVSMILEGLSTTTTVEFQENLHADDVSIDGKTSPLETVRVSHHLDLIRQRTGIKTFAKVVSQNTFPAATGLSSSSSAFAALTIAAARAAGLNLSQRELSILARQGSGSACRCVCGGFVEWHTGESSETSFAETLFSAKHWDVRDVVAIIDEGKKKISSSEGHESAQTSPFYQTRLSNLPKKIAELKNALQQKDFTNFGEIVEAEALEFHSILFTSQPSLIMWYPGTIDVVHAVLDLRKNNVPAYFTINTGFNVHVLTLPKFEKEVAESLQKLPTVRKILSAKVGDGPKELDAHLF